MKRLILLIALLATAGNAFSQYYPMGPRPVKFKKFQVLDSAYLKCTYRLSYVQDSLNANTTSREDVQTLLIGKQVSKYFSQNLVDYSMYVMEKGFGPNNEIGTCSFEVYKNYPENKITVTDLGGWLNQNGSILYEDKIPKLKWVIKNDTATILSYKCQRAILTFRGREYEAWFATDIPINNGPWKLGGLPGLILKVGDKKQNFVFECIGIEQLKKKEPIKFYDLGYAKMSRKDLDKLYRRLHDDPWGYINYTNSNMAGQGPAHSPKLPYNPIELE